MSDDIQQIILGEVREVRKSLTDLGDRFDNYRVDTEGRLTRVEVKSSIFGTVGGVIGGVLAQIFGPK